MKLGTILLAFAAGILVLPSAYADSPRSVDARELDIAGVKTGMDFDQARAAAAKYLKVAPSEIKPYFHKENLTNFDTQMVRDIETITGARRYSGLSYEKDKAKLNVEFEPRVPVDKARPLVVALVTYEIPDTAENAAAMKEAALAKYGEPSVDVSGPSRMNMYWCAKPSGRFLQCNIRPEERDEAVLKIQGVSMRLYDPIWDKARQQFLQDLRDSKAKTKPKF